MLATPLPPLKLLVSIETFNLSHISLEKTLLSQIAADYFEDLIFVVKGDRASYSAEKESSDLVLEVIEGSYDYATEGHDY